MDYLLLLSSIALGALCVLVFKLHEPRHVKLLNAFTGAYLLCLTFLHLLPDLYHDHDAAHGPAALLIGSLILAGFFLQIGLDFISLGVEHGHAHHLHHRMPVGVIVGLCLHAFVEAMALGDSHSHFDRSSRSVLLLSIVLHNFPVSIALMGMLMQSGMKKSTAFGFLALFAAMAPLGMAISAHSFLANYTRELMAIVVGIFMHIATTILFETSDLHRFNLTKLIAILVGTALGYLTIILH
jgi:zinc transporter ZupT